MSRSKYMVLAALALVVLAVGVWWIAGPGPAMFGDENGSQPERDAAVPVRTAAAAPDTVHVMIEGLGTLEARDRVTVTTEVSGRVTAINFEEGEIVRKGELLVELEARSERATVEAAEARSREARQQYERAAVLLDDGHIAQARVDERRAAMESAKAELRRARVALADHTVLAPFDGRVGFRRVSVGARVDPSTPLTVLTSLDPLDLRFNVSSDLIPRLSTGMEVRATAEAAGNETFFGRVRVIRPQAEAATQSVELIARVPNSDGMLRPGLTMDVALVLETRESIVVPEESVVLRGAEKFVFVVDEDGVAQRRDVRTGERRRGEVEIVEGLEEGDEVVIEGIQKIASGRKVRPMEDPAEDRAKDGAAPASDEQASQS